MTDRDRGDNGERVKGKERERDREKRERDTKGSEGKQPVT